MAISFFTLKQYNMWIVMFYGFHLTTRIYAVRETSGCNFPPLITVRNVSGYISFEWYRLLFRKVYLKTARKKITNMIYFSWYTLTYVIDVAWMYLYEMLTVLWVYYCECIVKTNTSLMAPENTRRAEALDLKVRKKSPTGNLLRKPFQQWELRGIQT